MSNKIKLYGIDIESDDDIDYIPDDKELKEDEKSAVHQVTKNVDEIYQEMKKINIYQVKVCTKTAAQIAKEVLEEQNKVQVKRVIFAGKSFLINDKGEIVEESVGQTTTKPIKQVGGNALPIKELRESFKYYREVIKKLTNRAKTINSITKSKLDWKQYTTKEKIEQQMEQNRKSGTGVIAKASFLNRANERAKLPVPKYTSGQKFEVLRKVNRGQSADDQKKSIKNTEKTNTPPTKRTFNQDISSNQKQNKDIKKATVNGMAVKQLFNKPQKMNTATSEFDLPKDRISSQYQRPLMNTPVKKIQQPIQIPKQRLTQKPQEQKPQQIKPQPQKIQVQPGLRIKTQQQDEKPNKMIETKNLFSPKEKANKEKPQFPKSNKLSPQRDSFSPVNKIGPKSQPRLKSPIKLQEPSVDHLYKVYRDLARPIFKDAKYYQTSAIHFLREQYIPKSSQYRMQFQLEFQGEKDKFKQLFCDHFVVTYNSLWHCKNLQPLVKPNLVHLNPPKEPKMSKGQVIKTIIFDLDETLIHCNDHNDDPTDFVIDLHMPNEQPTKIHFNLRPHCKEMLKVLSYHYELILFTASFKEYADAILEKIDQDKSLFSHRLYRDSCLEMQDGLLIKDLSVIEGRKLENMVLVDNSAYCYYLQLEHGIPIIPFYDNKKDKELLFLTDYLLKVGKQQQWIYLNKQQFKNYIYLDCPTIEDCIRRVISAQNY